MASTWGERLKLSVFGESHGPAIGAVLDGLPAGEELDRDELLRQMARRAPGRDTTSTSRKESDSPEILSGLLKGRTTGAPLCAVIRNSDTHSRDYEELSHIPRPGHADYTAFLRYKGGSDYRGGGHFSGRLTAPITFAGSVCRQILKRRGVEIGAHLLRAGGEADTPFDAAGITPEELEVLTHAAFPTIDEQAGNRMREAIDRARLDGDSVGGVIECAVCGMPAGIGDPMFGGLESRMASLLFGIPAVKGVEFGEGFASAGLRGSENNDPFLIGENGDIRTASNRHGGILGGISSSMPILFRVAFKPTPSIFKPQQTIDLATLQNTTLQIHGRHDPCVAIRAVPVVESAAAICLLDCLLEAFGNELGG